MSDTRRRSSAAIRRGSVAVLAQPRRASQQQARKQRNAKQLSEELLGSLFFFVCLVVFYTNIGKLSPHFQGPTKPFSHKLTPNKNHPFEVTYLQEAFPKVAQQVANLSDTVSRAAPAEFVLEITAKQAQSSLQMLKGTSENLSIFGSSSGKAGKLVKELQGQYENTVEYVNQAKEDLASFRDLSADLNHALAASLDDVTYQLAAAFTTLKNEKTLPMDKLEDLSKTLVAHLTEIGEGRKSLVSKNRDAFDIINALGAIDGEIKKISRTKLKLGQEAKHYLSTKKQAYDEYKTSCNLAGYFCSQDPVPKLEDFENWLLCGLYPGDDCLVTSTDLTRARNSLLQLLYKAKDEFSVVNKAIGKLDIPKRHAYPYSRSWEKVDQRVVINEILGYVKQITHKVNKSFASSIYRDWRWSPWWCWISQDASAANACVFNYSIRGKDLINTYGL